MAQRPTVNDVFSWMNVSVPNSSTDANDYNAMVDCVATAIERIEAIVSATLLTENGFDMLPNTTNYPNSLRRAEVLMAAKLYKSRVAPEGDAAFGGQAVRISPTDGDWYQLIDWLVENGFA